MADGRARTVAAPALTVRGRTFAWGERTYVMGILNVTPDSFSGDGLGGDVAGAVARAREMEAAGADILDVGAESSRPGAAELDAREELARLLPALEAVRAATALPISVDTYHASVAEAALQAGADIVNDIWGLRHDPELAAVVASSGAPLVAMHNQRGRPPCDVVDGVRAGFEATLAIADAHGIPRERIILDPGFGFGWPEEQNLEMVRRLEAMRVGGLPLLLGPSRKSTIGAVLDVPVEERLEGTAAAVAIGVANGADIVRVHDVRAMVRVVRVADAIARGTWRRTPAAAG
ncbi:MAG: dihydropteroate synthase [Dehalococcoidia bacterium]|nr:dihydropteroate synthase [Dehalococcoidia bacterium]